MKKSINFILFLMVFLFANGSNVLAAEHSAIIPITGDERAHFEIHPEVYKRWAEGKDESTDETATHPPFDENRLNMSGKKISDNDQNFKEFREKHKKEAAVNKADDPQWNAYELDLKQDVGCDYYGNFVINSSGIDDGSMYNIWPEQVEMYLSSFDESTNSWSEPKKLNKKRSYDEQGKGFYVIQDYKSSHDGRKYLIDLSLQPVDYYKRTQDKFRIYIFQGWPKPIPKDLLPGTYNIPLSIRYSNSPGKYSMADGAVEDNGELIVGQDGSIKLRIKFKPMTLSDPAYTGGQAITGHLMKLWTYNSVDDFDKYMKSPTVFTAKEIALDNPQFLKKYFSENVGGIELSFPEIYEIPLKYEDGSTNYESQKLFKVKVDAMGNSLQNFNLLMRWEDMKLEKLDLQSGKYKALPIISLPANQAMLDALWDKENNKIKYTREQYNDELIQGNYNKLEFNPGEGIIPIYDLEIRNNKADITVYWAEQYKKGTKLIETGLVKIDDSKPIQYKSSDGSIKDAEVLDSKDFTVTNEKNTYKNRITKIILKDVPLSINGEDKTIGLINARFIRVEEGKRRIKLSPGKNDDPIEDMFSIPNYDIGKKVLEEKIEEINKDNLNQAIEDAKSIKQGKKTNEAFNTLKAAITSAEGVLNSATEQNQLDEAVTTLNKAIDAFKNSPEKQAQLNKTELDAKIQEASNITQGKKSEDAFKTLKAAIEAAKNVLNSANTQDQINEALTNLNKAIEAFSKSADVTVTPGASEKVYTIPVKLMHSAQDKESMGNKALVSPAKVSIKGNDVSIDLTFQGIEVPLGATKFYGHLTNLFSFKDNTIRGEAIPAEVLEQMGDKAMDGSQKQFPKVFRIKLTKDAFDNLKDNTLYVKVWVDAMDGIAGGTPGAGAQNARLVFDKANMADVTPGGETPTPPTPPTPNLGNKDKLIDALRSYSNLGGSQYTYDSNMKYVNAYNSAMALLSRDNVTDSDINSAISNLKSAAAGLTLDTSKSNNSGNNQGWGNNNQGWGNNNQGWGNNNQGWGNNNRGWGNNNSGFGNNNSAWNNQNNKQNNGPVTIQYEVPVEVLHAHQSGYSMANAAINHTARVEERDGKFRYTVNFHAIQRDFGGKTLTGNLTNLFIIDGNKYRADQSGNTWSWVMNGKYDRVNVAVWVDAMDEIAGKGPGGGEQNAILSFNWNGAKEVGRYGGNNNQQNQQNQNQQNQQNQQKQQNQNQQAVQNNNTNNFTDTSGHWAKTAIDYVVSKGYFAGLSKTEFGPNKSITRGQFVSVLGRMLNVNVNDYKDQNFKDVKSGMYYSPYITWANKVGIVSGVGQGNFAPDKELTREEMAVMMTKFLKVSGKNLNAKGNTNGFKDEEKIQSWAKNSVKEMARLGVVSGMGDGKFAPKSPFTRAQVAQVLYNIDHN